MLAKHFKPSTLLASSTFCVSPSTVTAAFPHANMPSTELSTQILENKVALCESKAKLMEDALTTAMNKIMYI